MHMAPVVLEHVAASAHADGRPVISFPLFVSETFVGVLVLVEAHGSVPLHVHEHKDECFDVIEGEGVILVAGSEVRARPGTLVFVPAGTQHGLRNDGEQRWLLRETVHDRIYARAALALVWRAVLKRLPVIGQRWR
jgi:mannose-6-phosphate isomerase-like protein (cupin superfamily)